VERAVLDSDASLDYRSPFRDPSSRRTASVAEAAAGGALRLPYPNVLPLPPLAEPYERVHGGAARTVKRAFDLIGAILLLVILTPAWLAIALAIKFDSQGPVLFRQRRIGRDGEPFWIFKFRTMIDGADEQKSALLHLNEAAEGLFKISGDPRVTRVGGWLRATSLDELPQLLNVVVGRMSLVGPRPLVPEEDARIVGKDRHRLAMRPGMTGVWQVGGASTVPIRQMVVLDGDYLEEWSMWLDLKILVKTARLVVLRQGV
jgi:lipopolysaccharide/colanic/teichoic acid biosynthesis glycosyltransferase